MLSNLIVITSDCSSLITTTFHHIFLEQGTQNVCFSPLFQKYARGKVDVMSDGSVMSMRL